MTKKKTIVITAAILLTAVLLSIPIIRGIGNHKKYADFEKYTTDGLHFNDAGHGIIAQRLKEFIDSL